MNFLSPAVTRYFRWRHGMIDNFLLNPVDTQMQVFNHLIGQARFCEFGKRFDFDQLNSIRDFKKAVPISEYQDLKPYIDRLLIGEQNILWNSPIEWFAKSSGTVGDKSKFIPVSQETLNDNHYKAAKDILSLYLRQMPQSSLMQGKCLTVGGSHQINKLNVESSYGDLSAVMLQNLSLFMHRFRSPDLSVALMDKWEDKLEEMVANIHHENITFIAGVPTWILVLLKRLLAESGETNLLKIWPNLELYIHGGVNFKPYEQQFKQLIPNLKMHYLETYNASEGFFAAQDDFAAEGMLLFLNHGIFYEFMPITELGKDNPQTLTLKEVERGPQYALIISTNSGLWRYMVGDTVTFTSLYPFRIKVTGRTKCFINAFGEEVIIENTDEAMAIACQNTGAVINDYTVAPIYMSSTGKGGHEWLVEFEKLPVSKDRFIFEVDNALKTLNSDYEAKRQNNIAMDKPMIKQMPKGGFQKWLKKKGKLGGQNKILRLRNDRKLMEELLDFTDRTTALGALT